MFITKNFACILIQIDISIWYWELVIVRKVPREDPKIKQGTFFSQTVLSNSLLVF